MLEMFRILHIYCGDSSMQLALMKHSGYQDNGVACAEELLGILQKAVPLQA
jgi:hypothetical protein